MKNTPAHLMISWVFLILIGIVFGYSYFFYPNEHPLNCAIKAATGRDCATCGFSRAFSCFTHLEFEKGNLLNGAAFKVFMFFGLQFLIRLGVILHYAFTRRSLAKSLVIADILITCILFLWTFLPILM